MNTRQGQLQAPVPHHSLPTNSLLPQVPHGSTMLLTEIVKNLFLLISKRNREKHSLMRESH